MESLNKNYLMYIALLLSSSIIGAAFIYSAMINKYEISTSPYGVFRLNKATGVIDYCHARLIRSEDVWVVDCSGKHEY